ncbi:hypothetical protein Rs2_00076 [Raphanus sativus]|nr:hypothetical protein Rs2_00076 [Raphanus sativus]
MPRLQIENSYYTLEYVLSEEIKTKERVTCLIKIVGTICVYAAICKQEGSKFVFPESRKAWKGFTTASRKIWAAGDPYAKNKAFNRSNVNCSNADVFKWKHMGRFLLSSLGSRSMDSREGKKGKERVWEEMVKKNQLREKKLDDVGVWWFTDVVAWC